MNVPVEDKPIYQNRKGEIKANILAAVTPNLQFTYVLTGWEGSAADGRVLKDAWSRKNELKVPKGKNNHFMFGLRWTNVLGLMEKDF